MTVMTERSAARMGWLDAPERSEGHEGMTRVSSVMTERAERKTKISRGAKQP